MGENIYNQHNENGAIGTQGQVGDNTLNISGNEVSLEAIRQDLKKIFGDRSWPQGSSVSLQRVFGAPGELVDEAINQSEREIALDGECKGFSEVWLHRFEQLLPIATEALGEVAIKLLDTYAPVSPILKAIRKILQIDDNGVDKGKESV